MDVRQQQRENFTPSTEKDWKWTTWNPYVGCRKISPGCAHCYMFRDQAKYGHDPLEIRRTGDKTFYAPLSYKQPHLIFTCSWSDFFIEEADAWRDEVWDVIRRTPQHIYQVLTKRPERMKDCLPNDWSTGWPHVWLGVTTENQKFADQRIPLLLAIPAAMRWICAEPLLGCVDLSAYLNSGHKTRINWVIVGGESGERARPLKDEWVRLLRDQCVMAQVPFCYKQKTINGVRIRTPRLDGLVWDEMPPLPPLAPLQKVSSTSGAQLSMFD